MKKIAILGAGESGVGVSLLAKKHGYDVFVSDAGTIKERYKNILSEQSIPWEEGAHCEERILNADEIMKSPGIPDTAPIVKKIIARGIPIISEMEFCGRYMRGRTICVTGSNGKTTTTMLIYHIMSRFYTSVALGGNIGKSLATLLAEGDNEWYVIEMSSFQLDNCYTFHADIAVLMNITEDHLDRYEFDFQKYADSKMRIIQNQTQKDKLIFWAGDKRIEHEIARRQEGQTIERPTPSSALARLGNPTLIPFSDEDFDRYNLEISLIGRHNRRNALAAYLATLAAGVEENTIRQALKDFHGVEHRLEYVATKNGVAYINDSKATNVDACRVALEAMTRPTILIIGGIDKGNDYSQIADLVREKCRGIVFLGADNKKLYTQFATIGLPTADTHSMSACVKACREMARKGDVVLLSPCCASFDLFKNMEDRGEQFVDCVKKIQGYE